MTSNKINQLDNQMVYIKDNDVVVVHIEPYVTSILSREQAYKFGLDISKMEVFDKISINGKPENGYELVEYEDFYREPDITQGLTGAS